MTRHLLRDLENLKKEILGVGALVENAIHRATSALLDRRPELAKDVLRGDEEIDQREVAIEEDCLKILALHQPVAADLRYIIAVLKVNNDLERMGDLAVNIAERAAYLGQHPPLAYPSGFDRLVEMVRKMVANSLTALVEQDTDTARQVLQDDDVVDEIHRDMFERIQSLMLENSDNVERAMHFLSASRNLERIADQATNVAEDVIFMVEGDIIRHMAPEG